MVSVKAASGGSTAIRRREGTRTAARSTRSAEAHERQRGGIASVGTAQGGGRARRWRGEAVARQRRCPGCTGAEQ